VLLAQRFELAVLQEDEVLASCLRRGGDHRFEVGSARAHVDRLAHKLAARLQIRDRIASTYDKVLVPLPLAELGEHAADPAVAHDDRRHVDRVLLLVPPEEEVHVLLGGARVGVHIHSAPVGRYAVDGGLRQRRRRCQQRRPRQHRIPRHRPHRVAGRFGEPGICFVRPRGAARLIGGKF